MHRIVIASALAFAVVSSGCASSSKPADKGLTPDQTQDLFISAKDIPEAGIKRTVVSSYNPDTDFEVTILPPGSKARDKYDVVLPAETAPGATPAAYDTTVPCKICGSPVKIRIRRPQPKTGGLNTYN